MGCGASTKGPRDKYTNGEVLGSGMSCVVKSVKEKKTDIQYALKELKKKNKGRELMGQKELWSSEIEVLDQVKGPNILQLIDHFETDDLYCILTTLCTGGELFDRIEAVLESTQLTFSEKSAADLAKQMLIAIDFCHSQGVVHRDIKPENFVFSSADLDAPLTLIDFGCALSVGDDEEVLETIGSLYYFAPEMLFEQDRLDKYGITRNGRTWKKADVWSIGVIVFLLVCGQPPFSGRTDKETYDAIQEGKFKFPDDVKLSKPCKGFIKSLLTFNPAKRSDAKKALSHPWLTDPSAASDMPLPMQVLQGLSTFQNAYKLKHAVGQVMLDRLLVGEKRALISVFNQFDTDDDGILGVEEIGKMMAHIGRGEEKEVNRLMALMDDDDSGTITKEEFVAAAMASQLSEASEDDLRKTFNMFDDDGDGFCDQEEISKMFPGLKAEKIKEMIAEADTNGDNKISFEEWVVVMKN